MDIKSGDLSVLPHYDPCVSEKELDSQDVNDSDVAIPVSKDDIVSDDDVELFSDVESDHFENMLPQHSNSDNYVPSVFRKHSKAEMRAGSGPASSPFTPLIVKKQKHKSEISSKPSCSSNLHSEDNKFGKICTTCNKSKVCFDKIFIVKGFSQI